MNQVTLTALKKSFFITLIYVGTGTFSVLFLSLNLPVNEFFRDIFLSILILTLPVTCISIAFMYSSQNATGSVLIVQSIVFLLFWGIAFLIVKRRLKRKLQPADNIQEIS